MGLKDTFKSVGVKMFDAFDDVPVSVAVDVYSSSSYDVSTGVASAYQQRAFTTMIFSKYKVHQIDGERIQFNDIKAMCPQNSLVVVPHNDDKVTRVENEQSVVYDIVDVAQDSAGAMWRLQLRKL